MTDFGDHDPDDSYNADGEPDPLQLAIQYHRIRKYLADSAGEPFPDWTDIADGERRLAVAIFASMVAWLKRQGAI